MTTFQNRNKIIIHHCKSMEIAKIISEYRQHKVSTINLGYELAVKLKGIKDSKFINLEAHEILLKLIDDKSNYEFSRIVIHNLGILFEPKLSFDVSSILKELSKMNEIIILWDGFIENNEILHWGIKKEIYKINLSDIKPQIIDGQNEI